MISINRWGGGRWGEVGGVRWVGSGWFLYVHTYVNIIKGASERQKKTTARTLPA